MKRKLIDTTKKMVRLWISVVICFASFQINALSQEELRTFTKTIEVNPDVNFSLTNKYGLVEVTGWDKNSINIEAKIKAKGEGSKEFVDNVDINIQESKTYVSILTKFPDRKSNKNFSYSVDYKVSVPKSAISKLENEFGNMNIKELSGGLEINQKFGNFVGEKIFGKNNIIVKFGKINASELGAGSRLNCSHGSVEMKNCTGDLEVENSFGDCSILSVKGNLNVSNKYGKIEIDNVVGRADITNEFGGMVVNNIGGIIELVSRNAEIKVKNVEGGRITNSYGNIRIEDSKGKTGLTITNNNGKVYVKRCNSNILLKNSFDYIEMEDIDGRVDIHSNNSGIELKNISSDIKVENSFGQVNIEGSGGDVNIRNQHADVNLKNLTKLGKTYDLETQFGSIRTSFPSSLSAQVNAVTSFGSIKTDFPLKIDSKSVGLTTTSGKLGNGDVNIKLETRNGSIYINSDSK